MLAPQKKSYDQPRQHIKKQRYYFANKRLYSQSNDFSSSHVWMWGLDHKESWMLKNWCFWILVLESLLTLDSLAFELWCWRYLKSLLRVPWTARRPNQSIQKEISSEYSLEGLMLKLQYFSHLMQRADSLEKTLKLRKIEGRKRGWQRMNSWMASPMQWTWVWASPGRWWRTGKPGMLQSMGSWKVGHDWMTEQQQRCYFEGYI